MLSSKRGFTLIELLVVIAIIGVLSAVVLASLNTARMRGRDAAVASNLAQVRSQAEIIHATQDCYGDDDGSSTCADRNASNNSCSSALGVGNTIFAAPKVNDMLREAMRNGGTYTACRATGTGSEWAIAIELASDNTTAWCIDSLGTSRKLTLPSAATTQDHLDRAVNSTGHSSTAGATRCNPNY